MNPIRAAAVLGGIGLLKGFSDDARYRADAEADAESLKWNPWTKLGQRKATRGTSPFAGAVTGGVGGYLFGSSNQAAAAPASASGALPSAGLSTEGSLLLSPELEASQGLLQSTGYDPFTEMPMGRVDPRRYLLK